MTKEKQKKTNIGIFSFFSGAGFLDLGFDETEGFETVFVNEYHEPFIEIYKASRKGLDVAEPEFGHSTDDICSLLNDKRAKLRPHNMG